MPAEGIIYGCQLTFLIRALINYMQMEISWKANVRLKVFKSSSTSVPSLILIAHLLLLQTSFF